MKEKRFTLFWKKLLIMNLGLIVILVRIFGMVWGYLTKKSNNDSIFPQSTENGYPFFDSINCDISNILLILDNILLDKSNKTDINNNAQIFDSFINSFKSNECSFNDKINICLDNKKCFDELEYKEFNLEKNLSEIYNINNQGKMKISNVIKLFQEKNEFYMKNINKNKIEIESYYKLISGYNSYLILRSYEQDKNNKNYDIIREITNYEDKVNNLFYAYSLLLKAYNYLYPNKFSSIKTDSINYINECLRENEDQFTNKKSILFTNELNKDKIFKLLSDELIKIINCVPDFESRLSYSFDIKAIKTTIEILSNENNKEKINKNDKKIFNFFLKEFSKCIKAIFIADVQIRQKANIFLKYQPYFIIIFICISIGGLIFTNRYFIKNRQYYNQGSKILEKYKRDRYNFMYNNKHHQYMAKLKELEEKRKEEENKRKENLDNNINNNINANGINNNDNDNNLDEKDKCTKEELEYIEKLAKEHKGDFILTKK